MEREKAALQVTLVLERIPFVITGGSRRGWGLTTHKSTQVWVLTDYHHELVDCLSVSCGMQLLEFCLAISDYPSVIDEQ